MKRIAVRLSPPYRLFETGWSNEVKRLKARLSWLWSHSKPCGGGGVKLNLWKLVRLKFTSVLNIVEREMKSLDVDTSESYSQYKLVVMWSEVLPFSRSLNIDVEDFQRALLRITVYVCPSVGTEPLACHIPRVRVKVYKLISLDLTADCGSENSVSEHMTYTREWKTAQLRGNRSSVLIFCTLIFVMLMWNIGQLHGAKPFSWSDKLLNCSRISQHFMEPEGSVEC
jgi:hypothetical protein